MASPLGKLLGRSPIAPIQQHMQLAEESVQLLCELITAAADKDWLRVDEIHGVVESTARESRSLRREIRQQLPRGLLLAMPRPDLLTLLDVQTRISATVREIARPLALRGMTFPPAIYKQLDKYCSMLAEAAGQALAAIRELDELVEQGFGKQERRRVEKLLNALERQLRRCNDQHDRFFRALCKAEADLPAVDAMFYYRIAAALDALAAACGETGEQLQLLLAH